MWETREGESKTRYLESYQLERDMKVDRSIQIKTVSVL